MGMPALSPPPGRRWTADEVRELQDERRPWPRYELINGELLVSSSPTVAHQRCVRELLLAIAPYTEAQHIGETFSSPADIELVPESIVQPDVFVVPKGDRFPPREWPDVRALLLAVEVLSPSTARYDRVTKRRFFARANVPEYWVVDIAARVVERWRPADERPEILDDRLLWHPDGASEPLVIALAELFAAVDA